MNGGGSPSLKAVSWKADRVDEPVSGGPIQPPFIAFDWVSQRGGEWP